MEIKQVREELSLIRSGMLERFTEPEDKIIEGLLLHIKGLEIADEAILQSKISVTKNDGHMPPHLRRNKASDTKIFGV